MSNQNRAGANCEGIHQPVSLGGSEREADWRARSFELVGPTYIVDCRDEFVDWNPAFEELIATPLRLVRHQIRREFALNNSSIDRSHSQSAVTTDAAASQVLEDRLELELPGYGPVAFRRIAAQILDDGGTVGAWSVHLVMVDPDQSAQLWPRVVQRLEHRTTWSKYATVYDALLLNFTDYVALLEVVAGQVAGARVCIDLGAGTGNSAFALLDGDAARSVCAVDSNEFMLNRLLRKANSLHQDRLSVYQCDIYSMPCFADETFDGATMVNTLYALDDPASCLQEVWRIMKQNGILVLTTPHNHTDVDRLFARLREDLTNKGIFDSQEDAFHAARERHSAMDSMIHRFTIEELRSMVESCGFDIESISSEYVDAVVLIKARKR